MPTTREYRSIADCAPLLESGSEAGGSISLFDRPLWFELLHDYCLSDRQPIVIRAQEDDDAVWLVLIETGSKQASALANWYSFRWGPIFTGYPDDRRKMKLLDAAMRHLLARFSRIDLYPMDAPADLLASLRRAGWFAVARPMGGRYLLDLDGRDFERWWAERPGRLRNLVRRKARAGRYAIDIHDRLTPALWDDYVDVDARSWKQPETSLPFLRALAEAESAAGRLRIGFAREGASPVATQFWSIDRDTALIHKLSHDATHDAGSPGTLLSHAMFERAIDRDGVAHIDYGTGDNGYKADWMDRRVPLYQVDAFNPRRLSAWLPAARTAISALVG